MDNKTAGQVGESLAVQFLEKRGYTILQRNFAQKFSYGVMMGEVDIIAQEKLSAMDRFLGKSPTIVFAEVKCSKNFLPGLEPEVRVDALKKQKIARLAELWLGQRGLSLDTPWRIDVVSVADPLDEAKRRIEHYQNI